MKVFKRFLAMVLTLAMVATLFAGISLTASAADTTYKLEQVTSVSAGEKYVFVQGGHAMSNTVSSSALQTTTSYASTGLTGTEAYVWTLEATGSYFYLKNCSKSSSAYLNNTSSTSVAFGSASSKWNITFSGNDALFSNTSNSNRFLGYTSASSYAYKAYATSNMNSYPHAITVYKLVEESSAKTITGILVDDSAVQKTFTVGDTFNSTGLKVDVFYSDSTDEEISSGFTVSSPNMSTAGSKTVTVSYEGFTDTYTITVNPRVQYTLTYSVNGETSVVPSVQKYANDTVSLPASVTAPAGYTFGGWVAGAIPTETTTAPAVLTGSYSMPAANTTLYAVFTRTEGSGGSGNTYTLTDSLTDGDYMFGATYSGSIVVPNGTVTGGWMKYGSFTPSSGVLTNSDAQYVWTLTNQAGGGFTLKNKSTGEYLYLKSATGSGTFATDSSAHNCYVSTAVAADKSFELHDSSSATASSGNQAVFNYNNGSGGYRMYAQRTTSSSMPCEITFYKGGAASTTYYTTSVDTSATYYTLTYSCSPAAGGSILTAPDLNSGDQVEEDTDVELLAVPEDHYVFSSWTVSGTSNYIADGDELVVTMDADVTVTANFTAEPTYTVTVTQPGVGGTLASDKLTGIYAGETVTLTATPDTHYTFDGWNVTGASVSGDSFTMPAGNVTVTGSFTEDAKYTVTFYASSLAADTASALSTQSVYGGDCATAPNPGTKSGFSFIGWYTTAGTWSTNPGVLSSANVDAAPVSANVTYYGVWAEGDSVGGTFKLSLEKSGTTYYVGGISGKYLTAETSEADAAEFGIDAGGYLYILNGATKTYISNTASAADITNTTNISSATAWTVTENNGTISFESTATGRELAFNSSASPKRFAAYNGSSTYPYVFDKIGGTAASEYTTAPVLVPSHTVTWYNGNEVFSTSSVKEGTAIAAPETDPAKADYQETYYTFAGWSATDGGSVVSSLGSMGTTDKSFYAVFTPASYSFTAAISGADTMKEGRSKVLTSSLTASPEKATTGYTAVWSSSDQSKVTVDQNGRVTGQAEGSAVITVTYTLLDGTTATATKTVTVTAASSAASGYTLITADNAPEDWSGDYIIMGKESGASADMNNWFILTPDYDGGSVAIAGNYADAASVSLTDDGSGVGSGTIADHGNSTSGINKNIEMEDTGLVTDGNGDDSILVYDTITSIDPGYAFTVECIDDINQIYTIRVKDTELYVACSASTSSGNNSLNFTSSATEYAQWHFSVDRHTSQGYNNDIITAQNVGNSTRRLYFNAAGNGQFRDYHNAAYTNNIGTTGDTNYSLYFFGNPNPFKAQIYYQGDQITLVDVGEVPVNATTATVTGALHPDIDDYPNWTLVSGPAWTITENSSGNNMTINGSTGEITLNGSSVGSYALVKVNYVVHDTVNNLDHNVSTVAKVVVTPSANTYSTVIYETYDGNDTEVQYTVNNTVSSLPLAAYVVNDASHDDSKTGDVVMGGTLSWSAVVSTGSGTATIDSNGVLSLSGFTADAIITVTVSGATGDTVSASNGTYKVYIKAVTYTTTIINATNATTGTYNSVTDTITYSGSETAGNLGYNVVNGDNQGPGASTFSLSGGTWTISGDAQGALINSSGVLDFTGMDRTVDHTITVLLNRVTATTAVGGVVTTNLSDTITVVVLHQEVAQVMTAVNDTVIIDWALPVTFNVLANDDYNVEVSVSNGTLPSGVVSNGDGSFTYTPSGWQTTDRTFTYTLTGTVNGSSETSTATVTLKTADSVYYEDTVSGIFTFSGSWSDLTAGTAVAEQTSSLDTADIFEYDANYASYAQYSGGTAKSTTVSKGVKPSVSFTFAGTGFDVISATTNNTGAIMLTVKDSGGQTVTDPETGRPLNQIVDTFRGYTFAQDGYTRYGIKQVTRLNASGIPDASGSYYYDSETETLVENNTWYSGDTSKYYDNVNELVEDDGGDCILITVTSNWLPYDISGDESVNYNTNYYQIPVIRVTGLPYGTYTVTVKPTYSAAYDRPGDGSYDFIFDGVRIHNPVSGRAAEYKYISIRDAVASGGFGSGTIVTCDHEGKEWSDWTFYSRARNTNSATTCNRGSYVQYCSYCGGVANTAYFHVAVTADNTELGVGGYNNLPATTQLRYTLTADANDTAGVQAAIQAKLNALAGTYTEYWSSNSAAVFTCTNNSSVVVANGEGTSYATLQLKDPNTQEIMASAIHSPSITVYEDTTHTHTFGDWAHDADSDPSTHSRSCTGENCSFTETEACEFTSAITTAATATETGVRTYTCSTCGFTYTEVIPALGGVYTATFHVPAGATAPAQQTGASATMPAAVAAPASFDAETYTFIGWAAATVNDTTTEPAMYEAGEEVALTADTDFYALYTYGGAAGSGYTLSATAPQDGDSVIIAGKDSNGTYYGLWADGSDVSATELTVSGNAVTNGSELVWTASEGSYNNASSGIVFSNGSNPLHMNSNALKAAATNQNGTFAFTASGSGFIMEGIQNGRWLTFNGSSFGVTSSEANASTVYFFIQAAGVATYTTELRAQCHHEGTTTSVVTAPTCTAAGYTTYTCSACGASWTGDSVAALGHTYACVSNNDGTHTLTCSRTGCGDSYTEDCTFDAGVVSGSIITFTCTQCGYSYTATTDFAVSYSVQSGVTYTGNSRNGNAITLPASVTIPNTYDAHSYTLVGWATATAADSETEPTCYEPGEVVTITDDTTFYPVYSYTTGTSSGGDYVKVTSAPASWVGNYLIVYEGEDMILDGSLTSLDVVNNYQTVTISNDTISAAQGDPYMVTIAASGSNYTIQTKSGYYIGATSNTNSLNTSTSNGYTNTISYNSGNVDIVSSGGAYFRFNTNSGQDRFRYFKSGTYSSQQAIQLYKQQGGGGGSSTTTYTFTLAANVIPDNYTVTVNPSSVTLPFDGEASLTVILKNNGAAVTPESVDFTSGNSNLVVVDASGNLLAGDTAGTTTITVDVLAPDSEIYTATVTVKVVDAQSSDVTINYMGSATGNVYNWGTRDTVATFMTPNADSYYTGSYSYSTLSALSGSSTATADAIYNSALGTALHNMLAAKQDFSTSYGGTTSLYKYTDCEESNQTYLSSYYSGTRISNVWDSGATWNREHTWPNSKGLDGSDEDDIMMLRPTAKSENGSRSNIAYGESGSYYDPNGLGQNLHGDVARLMLQHLMRYGNTSKFYGTGGVIENRTILLKWLAEDPVDTWELGRNDAVERITGVRNVFVDYPELAFILLGESVPANYVTPSSSGIVASATYNNTYNSSYEPVTYGSGSRSLRAAMLDESIAPETGEAGTRTVAAAPKRDIQAGAFNGAVIIDGKGVTNLADDFAAYGPKYGVYLAPGQGIVFSLTSSDTSITTQQLQIGAKAVNGTAAQMDVASISNGSVSTGIKYLLENQQIVSATEMYYELDGSQVSWSNGESSVIVIYNSGSGVLAVTNLRYPAGNTLTMNINEVETQRAAKMIQIVYGEPETAPDPIVVNSGIDLDFKSASLSLESDIAINFYVDEEVFDSANGVYAVFTKALYNANGEITGYDTATVSNAVYTENGYDFRFEGINPSEMGSAVTATLYGYRDGELVSGSTVNYSVLTYVNNMYPKFEDSDFRALLADLVNYGAAAQNYTGYNAGNLVSNAANAGLDAYATAENPALTNATAMEANEGADVRFVNAYLSLREKVTVCYTIDAGDMDASGLELRISYRDYDGTDKTVVISDFASENGKLVAKFSGLNAVQMRTILTAEVFADGECVSSTLNYSIESYAQSKAYGNDALAALVNAMMKFGDSAMAYFAE